MAAIEEVFQQATNEIYNSGSTQDFQDWQRMQRMQIPHAIMVRQYIAIKHYRATRRRDARLHVSLNEFDVHSATRLGLSSEEIIARMMVGLQWNLPATQDLRQYIMPHVRAFQGLLDTLLAAVVRGDQSAIQKFTSITQQHFFRTLPANVPIPPELFRMAMTLNNPQLQLFRAVAVGAHIQWDAPAFRTDPLSGRYAEFDRLFRSYLRTENSIDAALQRTHSDMSHRTSYRGIPLVFIILQSEFRKLAQNRNYKEFMRAVYTYAQNVLHYKPGNISIHEQIRIAVRTWYSANAQWKRIAEGIIQTIDQTQIIPSRPIRFLNVNDPAILRQLRKEYTHIFTHVRMQSAALLAHAITWSELIKRYKEQLEGAPELLPQLIPPELMTQSKDKHPTRADNNPYIGYLSPTFAKLFDKTFGFQKATMQQQQVENLPMQTNITHAPINQSFQATIKYDASGMPIVTPVQANKQTTEKPTFALPKVVLPTVSAYTANAPIEEKMEVDESSDDNDVGEDDWLDMLEFDTPPPPPPVYKTVPIGKRTTKRFTLHKEQTSSKDLGGALGDRTVPPRPSRRRTGTRVVPPRPMRRRPVPVPVPAPRAPRPPRGPRARYHVAPRAAPPLVRRRAPFRVVVAPHLVTGAQTGAPVAPRGVALRIMNTAPHLNAQPRGIPRIGIPVPDRVMRLQRTIAGYRPPDPRAAAPGRLNPTVDTQLYRFTFRFYAVNTNTTADFNVILRVPVNVMAASENYQIHWIFDQLYRLQTARLHDYQSHYEEQCAEFPEIRNRVELVRVVESNQPVQRHPINNIPLRQLALLKSEILNTLTDIEDESEHGNCVINYLTSELQRRNDKIARVDVIREFEDLPLGHSIHDGISFEEITKWATHYKSRHNLAIRAIHLSTQKIFHHKPLQRARRHALTFIIANQHLYPVTLPNIQYLLQKKNVASFCQFQWYMNTTEVARANKYSFEQLVCGEVQEKLIFFEDDIQQMAIAVILQTGHILDHTQWKGTGISGFKYPTKELVYMADGGNYETRELACSLLEQHYPGAFPWRGQSLTAIVCDMFRITCGEFPESQHANMDIEAHQTLPLQGLVSEVAAFKTMQNGQVTQTSTVKRIDKSLAYGSTLESNEDHFPWFSFLDEWVPFHAAVYNATEIAEYYIRAFEVNLTPHSLDPVHAERIHFTVPAMIWNYTCVPMLQQLKLITLEDIQYVRRASKYVPAEIFQLFNDQIMDIFTNPFHNPEEFRSAYFEDATVAADDRSVPAERAERAEHAEREEEKAEILDMDVNMTPSLQTVSTDEAHKMMKTLLNRLIGSMNRHTDRNTFGCTVIDPDDVLRAFEETEAKADVYTRVCSLSIPTQPEPLEMFHIQRVTEKERNFTNSPIWRQIIGRWNCMMLEFALHIKTQGHRIRAFRTDCIYVEENPIRSMYFEPLTVPRGWHAEPDIHITDADSARIAARAIPTFPQKAYPELGTQPVDYTWNTISWDTLYNSSENGIVIGPGGSGKSTLLLKLWRKLHRARKNIFILAPTHAALCRLRADLSIPKYKTVASFFHTLETRRANFKFTEADVLLIDEVSMLDKTAIQRVNQWHKQYPNARIIMFGDFNQCYPVERDNSFKLLYEQPCMIKLLQNRCDIVYNPEYGRYTAHTYEVLSEFLRTRRFPEGIARIDPSLTRNISRRNATRHRINARFNQRDQHGWKFRIGQTVIASVPFKEITSMAEAGLVNNAFYTVERICVDDTGKQTDLVVRSEIQTPEEDPYLFAHTYFEPTQCITTHKMQGRTLGEPYNIYDVHEMSMDQIYTALSRCRDIREVHTDCRPGTLFEYPKKKIPAIVLHRPEPVEQDEGLRYLYSNRRIAEYMERHNMGGVLAVRTNARRNIDLRIGPVTEDTRHHLFWFSYRGIDKYGKIRKIRVEQKYFSKRKNTRDAVEIAMNLKREKVIDCLAGMEHTYERIQQKIKTVTVKM